MADGEYFPYVQDLEENRWHKRPVNDEWDTDGVFQAQTLCGKSVQSVHVSGCDPRIPRNERRKGDHYCKCLGKIEK